uniref:Uncharacterized protein n=1 Tax=mine drainage metagenome TaxID=410659 RepID=E6QMN4_9ZZZZ
MLTPHRTIEGANPQLQKRLSF